MMSWYYCLGIDMVMINAQRIKGYKYNGNQTPRQASSLCPLEMESIRRAHVICKTLITHIISGVITTMGRPTENKIRIIHDFASQSSFLWYFSTYVSISLSIRSFKKKP